MTGQATERGQALALLRRALDDPSIDFRHGQWEAIEALVNRRTRLLVVERTGWGKSSVYFIATRILRDRGRGPTLIVSPLLALMRNQIEAAGRLGIRALSINSTNRGDWPDLSRAILADEADAILISPERLANDEFVQTVLLPVARRIGPARRRRGALHFGLGARLSPRLPAAGQCGTADASQHADPGHDGDGN